MLRLVAIRQDTAVDAWMQRFNATVQQLGSAGVIRHGGDRQAPLFPQELGRSPTADQPETMALL